MRRRRGGKRAWGGARRVLSAAVLCAAALAAACRTEGPPVAGAAPKDVPAAALPAAALPGQTLTATLDLRDQGGETVAYQNGIPVPSFDPQERRTIALAGTWQARRFAADHDVTMARRTAAWIVAREKESGGLVTGRFDAKSVEERTLPAPENRITPGINAGSVERYEDGAWYYRTFRVDAADGASLAEHAWVLKLLGVSYVVDVWVNGTWLGWHEGGYTPFAFDVGRFLRPGDNSIALRVDNPPWGSRKDTIPAVEGTDFFNYTGVIQDLFIEELPAVSVFRADVRTMDTDGSIRLRVLVYNATAEERRVSVEARVLGADDGQPGWRGSPLASAISTEPVLRLPARSLTAGPRQAVAVTFTARIPNPRLWSPGHPALYVAEVSASESRGSSDTLRTQFGLRTLGISGTRILLNGAAVFLAGIARHEDWPGYGRTAAWDRIVRDFDIIRGLNANMVRTAHYPNDVLTYIALDRAGLAAMSEIPLWQFEPVNFQLQETRGIALQMWREMILSQYNRPSVFLWSTQNESNAAAMRVGYNAELVRDLRDHFDDGRLVTQSAAADRPGASDPSMAPLDVAGWTMYFGVFHGSTPYEGTRGFLAAAHAAWPGKPILNTEFGYWSGDRGASSAQQVQIARETLRALEEAAGQEGPFLAGIDYWTAFDWFVNHTRWTQTMGLFGMDRRDEKPVAGLIRESYARLTGEGPAPDRRPPA